MFKIFKSLNWGGAFFLIEKVRGPDARFQDIMTQIYREFKQDQGYTAIGYGAAAKGNTFLNYVETTLDAIIDDNKLKQNTYSPGKDIGVVSMDSLLENISDNHKVVFVPLAWNFFDEIKARILTKRNNPNDKFIRYFPEVRVV